VVVMLDVCSDPIQQLCLRRSNRKNLMLLNSTVFDPFVIRPRLQENGWLEHENTAQRPISQFARQWIRREKKGGPLAASKCKRHQTQSRYIKTEVTLLSLAQGYIW